MGKEENLVPYTSEQSHEEAVINGQKGGIASGEARRRKRDLRKALESLLEKEFTGKDGTVLSGAEALATKQFEKAMKGDTKAFEVIRDTAGQKPVQSIEVMTANPEIVAEIEEMVRNAEARDS